MKRRHLLTAAASVVVLPGVASAHHGWGGFDQNRPIYLEGRAKSVAWRNPHVAIELELTSPLKLPADLKSRSVPAQSAPVDSAKLLAAAQLPTRKDAVWHIELAPLSRMEAWKVAEMKPGVAVAVLGFTFAEEKGDAVMRAEYLFVDGKAYGLRSSPV
jgi:hypothetical protein